MQTLDSCIDISSSDKTLILRRQNQQQQQQQCLYLRFSSWHEEFLENLWFCRNQEYSPSTHLSAAADGRCCLQELCVGLSVWVSPCRSCPVCPALPAGISPASLMHTFPLTLRPHWKPERRGDRQEEERRERTEGFLCHTVLPGNLLRFCGMAASPLQQGTVNTEGAMEQK